MWLSRRCFHSGHLWVIVQKLTRMADPQLLTKITVKDSKCKRKVRSGKGEMLRFVASPVALIVVKSLYNFHVFRWRYKCWLEGRAAGWMTIRERRISAIFIAVENCSLSCNTIKFWWGEEFPLSTGRVRELVTRNVWVGPIHTGRGRRVITFNVAIGNWRFLSY